MCPHAGWILILTIAACAARVLADDPTGGVERRQVQLDARIAELIEQLGSPDFPVREKATRELSTIGLPAFDALKEAQNHRDLEVALRARYLIGSAQVAWARDDDPPEVKSILKGYGDQSEQERASRIERLALLEDRQGWTALCRLARYERTENLSKQAALAVITQEPPAPADARQAARLLQLGAGESRSRAAQWLRAYARWLNEPESILTEWNRLVDEEFELLTGAEKEKSSPEIATALARWHAGTLHRLGHEAETKAIVQKLVDILDRSSTALQDHIDWLGHREMWPLVLQTHARFSATIDEEPMLLYRLAQAQLKTGDNASAKKTAERALALAVQPTDHLQAGIALGQRGLFDWADAEYRAVIENEKVDSRWGVQARFSLAEMLHDQQREKEAGQALEPIAVAMEKADMDQFGKRQPNPMRQLLEGMGREPGSALSRMHYFFALDHLSRDEVDLAKQRLNQGAKQDATDADVLIALFRLPDRSEAEIAETRRLIRAAAETFQDQITESSRYLAQVQAQLPNADLAAFRRQLAMAHNQYAWLVANTEGDFEVAIASSHESLKLRPAEPAYLDTLGRCYYAHGDLASAIKYQSEAVRKEPHSGQMQRQLALFKREAEQRK